MTIFHEQYNGYEGQSVHPIIIDVYSNGETHQIQHITIRSNDAKLHTAYKKIGEKFPDIDFVHYEHNHEMNPKYGFRLKSLWYLDFCENHGVPIDLFIFHSKHIMNCSDNWKLHNSGKIFPRSDTSTVVINPNLIVVKSDNKEFSEEGFTQVIYSTTSNVCIWLGKIC